MSHYDAGEWTDFVRGLIDGPLAAAMRSHLANCQACRKTVGRLRLVTEVGRTDLRLLPPDGLVRWAQALWSTRTPQTASRAQRLVARLVYDSLAAPELAGVRSEDRISRHLLYEAGALSLDLKVDYERGSSRVALVGQVLDCTDPERSMADVSVRLVRGRSEVGRSQCNRFGEFQIEYEPRGRLRLYVTEGDRSRRVEIALTGIGDDRPDA